MFWTSNVRTMNQSILGHWMLIMLSPTSPVKELGRGESGVERHCSHSSSSRIRVRKEGRNIEAPFTLYSLSSILPLVPVNHTTSKNPTPTSVTMFTSSPSRSRRGDEDGGSGGRRVGAMELRWTTALGKAINRKRGGRRTHFGVSRSLSPETAYN
jgi:hypothetical protein